jgi:orotate phosphoribosyltransferase
MADREDFVELLVRSGALRFGDFVTKSGRRTPYFVDFGRLCTGSQLVALGRAYAALIAERFRGRFDVLFGPAYKGIPLAVAAASQLHLGHGIECAVCFDRKERKDHGEGGRLVGHVPRDGDRVLIIEDVTTAGTSLRETVPLLRQAAAVEIVGLTVAVDRMERGTGSRSALTELQDELGVAAHAIVTIRDVIRHLHGRAVDGKVVLDDAVKARMEAYLAEYGPAPQA